MSFVNLLQGLVLRTVWDDNATVIQQQSVVEAQAVSDSPVGSNSASIRCFLGHPEVQNSLTLEQIPSDD